MMMVSPGNGNYNKKQRSQRLILLVLALGMAAVCVMFLHKFRETRVLGILLQDQDQQILKLQFFLQKEREKSREMKRKLEDIRGKNLILRSQKMELTQKLMETQTTSYQLQKIQKEMEASPEEKKNQINSLTSKMEESFSTNLQVTHLTEQLKQKESEVKELKQQLSKPSTENTSDEVLSEQNEERTPKGQWVSFQTNADEYGERSEMSEESKTEDGEKGKEQSIEEDLNKEEPKRRHRKTRNRGRRRATLKMKEMEKNSDGQSSILQNEENISMKDSTVNSSTMEGEQKVLATETGKLEISEGSGAERSNEEGTTKAGEKNPIPGEQQGGNDQTHGDREGSKVDEGHNTDKIVGEGKKITTMRSEKSENIQEDEAKNEKTGDPHDNEAKNEKSESPQKDEDKNEKSENPQNDEVKNEKTENLQDSEGKNEKSENPQDDESKNEKYDNLQNDEARNEMSENPEDDEAKDDADNTADKNQTQISESTDASPSIEELNNEVDPETR